MLPLCCLYWGDVSLSIVTLNCGLAYSSVTLSVSFSGDWNRFSVVVIVVGSGLSNAFSQPMGTNDMGMFVASLVSSCLVIMYIACCVDLFPESKLCLLYMWF